MKVESCKGKLRAAPVPVRGLAVLVGGWSAELMVHGSYQHVDGCHYSVGIWRNSMDELYSMCPPLLSLTSISLVSWWMYPDGTTSGVSNIVTSSSFFRPYPLFLH